MQFIEKMKWWHNCKEYKLYADPEHTLRWRNRVMVFRKLHIVIEFDWQIKMHLIFFFSRRKMPFSVFVRAFFLQIPKKPKPFASKGNCSISKMQRHSFDFTILSRTLCNILDQLDLTASNSSRASSKIKCKPHSDRSPATIANYAWDYMSCLLYAVRLYFVNKFMWDFHLIKTPYILTVDLTVQ